MEKLLYYIFCTVSLIILYLHFPKSTILEISPKFIYIHTVQMIIIYIHYISQPKLMKYHKLCTFYPQVHGKLQMSPRGLFNAPLEQFSHQLCLLIKT